MWKTYSLLGGSHQLGTELPESGFFYKAQNIHIFMKLFNDENKDSKYFR